MSLKMKLISTISAFILVVSLMLVGILAAGSATLNIGGNVSFTANSVYAQITGSIEGTAEHTAGSPLPLSTIDIDYTDTETAIDLSGANSDWTTMPLNFDENASAITIKMNIENKATDRAIKITLTDNTSIGNVKVVRKYNDTTFEESTNTQTINGGEVARYEFTLSVQSQNNDISGVFDLDLSLENVSADEVNGYTASITNESNRTLYVMGDDGQAREITSNGNLQIKTSKISFALNSSSLQQMLTSNTLIKNNLNLGDVELYAPGSNSVTLKLNGDTSSSNYYFYEVVQNAWVIMGEPFYHSQATISEDETVITFVLTDNIEFSFT